MDIALIIVGLIVLAFVGHKINLKLTVCPKCGKRGSSKYLGRTRIYHNNTFDDDDDDTERYEENYECKKCGHHFSE